MKKIILTSIISILTYSVSYGAVTISNALVEGYQDEDGTDLGGGVLAFLVVDTAGDGFNGIDINTTVATDTFLSDGNDLVVNLTESQVADVFNPDNRIEAGGFQLELSNGIDAGDSFAVYWFPGLSESDSTLTEGQSFGIAYDETTWVLPSDGGSTNADTVEGAGIAGFLVGTPIPEPASTALLGLGGLALLARRRRA